MRRILLLLSALSLAVAAWTIGSAQANPTGTSASGQTHSKDFSAEQQRAALRFWTAERLRAAKDVTVLPAKSAALNSTTTKGAAPDTTPTKGSPVTVDPVAAPASAARKAAKSSDGQASASLLASSPTPWTGGGLIRTTAGKVFFQNASGGTFACSATVANSENRSLVLTAGHCVVDGHTGEVYRNWVFMPGYDNGNRPYGTFTASRLFNDDRYVSSQANANWDYGFAKLGTVNGRTVADTVGAQGITFNSATGTHVHSFGYGGSAAEGNGERLNHCEGDEFKDDGRPDTTMWGIDCVQSGGSSGGSFLTNFDTSTGGGNLIGNISVSSGSNEYHPYLGNEALTLYQTASTS